MGHTIPDTVPATIHKYRWVLQFALILLSTKIKKNLSIINKYSSKAKRIEN